MTWVLVDISWLAYRAMYTMGDLSFEDMPTGVIYGFFDQLKQICLDDKVQSNRVAIFCDSHQSIRTKYFPTYKGNRWHKKGDRPPEEMEMHQEMRRQRDLLHTEILPAIGLPVYLQDGLESDDLIAWCARTLSINGKLTGNPRRQGVIITSDGDLFQCISPWVHWYDPQRHIYHNVDSFTLKEGIHPRHWGEVKALSGCMTDNVPGIGGVGKGTAVKYLLGALPPKYKSHQTIISRVGRKAARRNRRLVVLPHRATDPIVLREPKYNIDAFFHYCGKYGMDSILRDKKAWISFFSGKMFTARKRGE